MIGYSLAHEQSLVAMAMVQGRQRDVVNVGLGVRLIAPDVDISAAAYAESQSHKVRLPRLRAFCQLTPSSLQRMRFRV